MRKFFLKFGLIFLVLSCGGGDESSNDVVIPPDLPSISVDKTSITFDDTMITKSSTTASVFIQSKNVESAVNVISSEGFEISVNNLDFGNSLTIDANESKTVYVRFSPSNLQDYNGSIDVENT
jgi:hypothetical protein